MLCYLSSDTFKSIGGAFLEVFHILSWVSVAVAGRSACEYAQSRLDDHKIHPVSVKYEHWI